MEQKKELDDMPIWQNHEQRITTLEVLTSNMQGEFKEVKDIINKGNEDQAKRLKTIDEKLMNEFFKKKQTTHETKMKVIAKITGAIVGGLSFLYIVIEKIIEGLGG